METYLKAADAVAEQIWREQQISSARLTWNLTFQGFLVAAFGLSLSSGLPGFNQALALNATSNYKLGFQIVIGSAGWLVALATRLSLNASGLQRDYLKTCWDNLCSNHDLILYPRPFAEDKAAWRGRLAANITTLTLLMMWPALIALTALARMSSP